MIYKKLNLVGFHYMYTNIQVAPECMRILRINIFNNKIFEYHIDIFKCC